MLGDVDLDNLVEESDRHAAFFFEDDALKQLRGYLPGDPSTFFLTRAEAEARQKALAEREADIKAKLEDKLEDQVAAAYHSVHSTHEFVAQRHRDHSKFMDTARAFEACPAIARAFADSPEAARLFKCLVAEAIYGSQDSSDNISQGWGAHAPSKRPRE